MIADLILEYASAERRVQEYEEDYLQISKAVAGDVTGLHYQKGISRSGPEEYMVCWKEEKHERLERETALLKKLQKEVQTIMQGIPDRVLRRIIWLRFYHALGWDAVGALTGLTAGAAKMKWSRFSKKERTMKNILEGREQPQPFITG